VRQDALDRDESLEALDAEGLRAKHLGHPTDVDALEQEVLAERSRLFHVGWGARFYGHRGEATALLSDPIRTRFLWPQAVLLPPSMHLAHGGAPADSTSFASVPAPAPSGPRAAPASSRRGCRTASKTPAPIARSTS